MCRVLPGTVPLSIRWWQKCLYLSKPVVLEQPSRIGNFQGVSSFHSLPFSQEEILAEDWVQCWGAVAFGNAHLQRESLAVSLAFNGQVLLMNLIHSLLCWSSPRWKCTPRAFHGSLCWTLLIKHPLLYRTTDMQYLRILRSNRLSGLMRFVLMNKTQGRLLSDLSPSQLCRHSELNSNENKTWFAPAVNQPSRTAWPRGEQLPAYWNPLLPFLTQTWWTSFACDHHRTCCNCWAEPVGEEISLILGTKLTKKTHIQKKLKIRATKIEQEEPCCSTAQVQN